LGSSEKVFLGRVILGLQVSAVYAWYAWMEDHAALSDDDVREDGFSLACCWVEIDFG
jgi:hypothetical protein